jgi:hypothetical protein
LPGWWQEIPESTVIAAAGGVSAMRAMNAISAGLNA